MPSYLTSIVLEFSEDDLSDTTPTWQDVTSYLIDVEWWAGIDNEGDDPEPGGCTIRLKNTNRDWEPEYTGSRFYPNVTSHRRFRLTLNSVQQGVWYTSNFQVSYPADGHEYSEVTIGCGDGCEVLALDTLPLMDPPDADNYRDVVSHDEPLAYYGLGDPAGTQVAPLIRRVFRGKGKKRRKVRVRYGWSALPTESLAVTGETGVFVDPARLSRYSQPSLILGDTEGSFEPHSTVFAKAPVDRTAFFDPNAVTVEAWVRWAAGVFCAGPFRTSTARHIFHLDASSDGRFRIDLASGLVDVDNPGAAPTPGDIVHIVGTWDGQTASLYMNGELKASSSVGSTLLQGNVDEFVYLVGNSTQSHGDNIDEVAFYEHALTAERVEAHYVAGSARGFDQQTAGERVAEIVTHDLWSEASVQTSGRDVMPQFKHGQGRLELVADLGRSEGPTTQFFFNRSGNPVYLGHEWQPTDANYNTVQATFGWSAGELPYDAIEPVHDNETYNEVVVSHESGESATVTGSGVPRRVNTDYTDVLLMEHVHVESLAAALFAFYENPAFRPKSMTVNGSKCLAQILDLDIGHLIRVKGPGSSSWDRVCNIIGKRYSVNADKVMAATYTLGRGFNADDGLWHAGIVGFSEAGATTVAA